MNTLQAKKENTDKNTPTEAFPLVKHIQFVSDDREQWREGLAPKEPIQMEMFDGIE